MKSALLEKISHRTMRIAIIGLGYVGLPLATAFAKVGFNVTGIDIDRDKISKLNNDKNTLYNAKIDFTDDYSTLDEQDAVIICVPTPLGATRDPDLSCILAVTQQIKAHLHPGQIISLESTTYPGTTDKVVLPALEATGLKVGVDFFLAFSPERIDPGNPVYNVHNTPKIVGGVTRSCTELTGALYTAVIERVIPVASTCIAEMAKILENTFRYINIGLINEMAIICDKLDISIWDVIEAAETKPFGFMRFLPGPGLGGHCIPVDPHYLSWKLKTLDYHTRFIQLAAEINSSMPRYVLEKIGEALNRRCCSFNGSAILLLGIAYKSDIDDIRESPSLTIMQLLNQRKSTVIYNDEYVPSFVLDGQTLYSQPLTTELLQAVDCVVVVTNHSYYDIPWIVNEAKSLVDTSNATKGYTEKHIVRI